MEFIIHRGTFKDSMETLINVTSKQEIIDILKDNYIIAEDIKFENPVYDHRNGWNSHTVVALIDGEWCAVGHSNGYLEK